MQKLLKLHLSEKLLLFYYIIVFVLFPVLLVSLHLNFQDFLSWIILLIPIHVILAVWIMVKKRSISPILYPLYIVLGFLIGYWLCAPNNLSGGPAAVWFGLGFFFIGIPTILHLGAAAFLTKKNVFKIIICLFFGILIPVVLDYIFISPDEVGEKGQIYLLEKYPAWRITDF